MVGYLLKNGAISIGILHQGPTNPSIDGETLHQRDQDCSRGCRIRGEVATKVMALIEANCFVDSGARRASMAEQA